MLLGYGIGRWQDAPAVSVAAPPAAVPSVPGSEAPSEPPSPSAPPPSPTVYRALQAEAADELVGVQNQPTEDRGGGQNAGWISAGDSLRFDNVTFGPVPATQLEVRVASDPGGGVMEVRLDSADGPVVGKLTVTRTGGWQAWRTDVVTLTPVVGVHTVYLTFVRPDPNEFINLNWLLFKH